jgi:hypothetical protein
MKHAATRNKLPTVAKLESWAAIPLRLIATDAQAD